jgi:hypothetical protein
VGVGRGALILSFVVACGSKHFAGTDAGDASSTSDANASKDASKDAIASDVVTGDASGCNQTTCASGCCSGGSCLPGTQDNACGYAALDCADCTQINEVCNGQVCSQPVCDSNSCPSGCCKIGQCLAGQSDQACGTKGATCIDCSASGLVCLNGFCTQ